MEPISQKILWQLWMSMPMASVGPDSRRSWIVAVSCFFVQVLTNGLTEASGLLFVATIPRFDTNREKASLPYTVAYCVRSAIGPIIGYLGRRFGIRQVTLFGCILSSISVAACFLANDVTTLIILWGVLFGSSLGLETSLLNVILNEHFVKHRVKANGLNISGASLGTLLLSPVIEHCVEKYGLSGTFLIISGLMLNSIPAVIVMILNKPEEERNIPVNENRHELPSVISREVSYTTSNNTNKEPSACYEISKEHMQAYKFSNPNEIEKSDILHSDSKSVLIMEVLQLKHVKNYSSFSQQTILPMFWNNKRTYSIPQVANSAIIITEEKSKKEIEKHNNSVTLLQDGSTFEERASKNNGSIKTQDNLRKASNLRKSSHDIQSKWQLHRLLCEPIYIIIIIGVGIYYFIITTFLTIIVDYATDLGISMTYATYIVMWIAMSDIFGYLFLGWIIELGYLSQSRSAALSFFCLCLMSSAMVWCPNFTILLVLISLFELGQCGVIIISAPLVAEYIASDLQATGIASFTILSSPITLAISPLIGFFRDGGGSYAGVFYVISALSFMCAILFLFIPKLEKRRNTIKSDT